MELTAPVANAKGKKAAVAAEEDFDDEAVFGDAAFNDDDIDLEGFEISDGKLF